MSGKKTHLGAVFAVLAMLIALLGVVPAATAQEDDGSQAAADDNAAGIGDVVGDPADAGEQEAPPAAPAGPDADEQAAIANNAIEFADPAPAPGGAPLVPQSEPVIETGVEDNNDEEADDAAPPPPGPGDVAGINGVSCEYATVEAAIAAAAPGGTVFIAPGTYPAQSNIFNYNISKNLDVEAGTATCQNSTTATSISVVLTLAAGSTSDAVMEVSGAVNVRFEHITIRGGNSSEGTLYADGPDVSVTLDDADVDNGDNPANSTTIGGGAIRMDRSDVTMINGANVDNSSAIRGGGVFNDGGTFTNNSTGDIEDNTATSGAGIYSLNNGQNNIRNNGDVLDNIASSDGGGVHLTSGADLLVQDGGSDIGLGGQANEANRGGGVFVNGAGSIARISTGGAVDDNEASFGAGVYGLQGEVEVNDGAQIIDNVGGNGAGILGAGFDNFLIDLNGGALIARNTGGLGAGVFAATTSVLDADGTVVGGSHNPVRIADNVATGDGGGVRITSSSVANLDGVHVDNNTAARGGGLYADATANVVENGGCGAANLALNEHCNEFRDNDATNAGGAVFISGGDFLADQTAFFDNTAVNDTSILEATGSSIVDLEAVLFSGHTSTGANCSITASGTSTVGVVAATFANSTGCIMDADGTSVWDVRRTIGDGLVSTPGQFSGACNVQDVGFGGMPAAVSSTTFFVTGPESSFTPRADQVAVDACASEGQTQDIFDQPALNGDGIASATEYDMGAVETPTGQGFFCNGVQATMVGTNGPDNLTGTGLADSIVALNGNDTVSSLGGNDNLCGGGGNDVLNGGTGNDYIDGSSGADLAFGQDGDDTIVGGSGNDTLLGFGNDDTINGGTGADVINGGSGNDLLIGGDQNDQIFAQGGNDTVDGGNGNDFIIGVDGTDNLSGGTGDDVINGGPGNDTVDGGANNDTIYGLGGNDPSLNGGSGNDFVFGQVGNDTVDGGAGNDNLWGNEQNDTITDPSGVNVINGGPDDDNITGGSGNDQIFGDGDLLQAGNDTLVGGGGSDLLNGFAGADTINSVDGFPDTVNGGPDVDNCTTEGIDTVFNCP
ncbi:MAG: hypothetical protein ACR2QE_09895 [Acidimicrobiales bacterium]